MKSHRISFLPIDRPKFNSIVGGVKTVETRAATEKYRQIEVGDELVFTCEDGVCAKRVKAVQYFKTIEAIHEVYPIKTVQPWAKNMADVKRTYDGFPGYAEKISEFGLVAIKFS